MSSKFQRKIEDFVCLHCSAPVTGNGFTNHCPHCLWSKHVDINPGDRASLCGGAMKPVRIEGITGKEVLVNRCEVCGYEKRNKLSKEDDFTAVLAIIKASSDLIG
jgi:uncharacterized protein (DUF983 family)